MVPRKSRHTTRWAFFPLKGLDVLNKTADLDRPMFGDATILSLAHIPSLLSLLSKSMKGSAASDLSQTTKSILDYVNSVEEFQSFVVVRRTASTPAPRSQSGPLSQEQWFVSARRRACLIASLISLVLLARSKRGRTCGLVEHLGRSSENFFVMDFDVGTWAFQGGGGGGHMIYAREQTVRLTRAKLLAAVGAKSFRVLSSVCLLRRDKLPKSLGNSIAEATLTLGIAVHSEMPERRLLGAVTAMEILLSDDLGRYETTERHLEILVGEKSRHSFRAKEVFRSRHAYVHRGQRISDPTLPLAATRLALLCLVRFAQCAPRFRSRTEMMDYLDMTSKTQSISWNSEQKTGLRKLTKLSTTPLKFPFLKT